MPKAITRSDGIYEPSMMTDESSEDKSPSNRMIIDELIAEKTVTRETGQEKNPADGPLRVSARRRWSDARSALSGRTSAAKLKAELNPNYPSQASLHALVDHVADLGVKIVLRRKRAMVLWLSLIALSEIANLMVLEGLLTDSIAVLLILFCFTVQVYGAYICVYGLELVKLWDTSEIARLRNFESIIVETLGHRQLEILCRYGDYLAERLNTLRQYIGEHGLEGEHELSEKWTETSATLRAEEGQAITPCRDLIRDAAKGLNWKHNVTVFMAHEYGKRNSLMHAELFDLVDTEDWDSIGQRCQEDIEKLRELFIHSNSDSQAAIKNWELIIGEFRDRWVHLSEDGSTWEAHLIVQEAIAAGIKDSASLDKLSMHYKDAIYPERDKAISAIRKEKESSEKQQKKWKKLADASLQTENKRLQAEVEKLRTSLEQEGVSRDILESLGVEIEKNDVLKKENETCKNRIKDLEAKIKTLEDDRAKGLTRQRTLEALRGLLEDLGFKATEQTITEAGGKQTTTRRKDTDTQKEPPTI